MERIDESRGGPPSLAMATALSDSYVSALFLFDIGSLDSLMTRGGTLLRGCAGKRRLTPLAKFDSRRVNMGDDMLPGGGILIC